MYTLVVGCHLPAGGRMGPVPGSCFGVEQHDAAVAQLVTLRAAREQAMVRWVH
jgi:hypothetical protein